MNDKPTLNAPAAQSLQTIAASAMATAFEAVRLTYESESWKHLGYESFADWATAQPKLQMTREERGRAIAELREVGLTQRQVAAAVGVSERTVQSEEASTRKVAAPEPEPEREEEAPTRSVAPPAPAMTTAPVEEEDED